MKTAVVFAGYFRTFDYTRDGFAQHIMNPLNADIFFVSPKTMFAPSDDEVSEFHHIHSQNDKGIDDTIGFFGDRLRKYEIRDNRQRTYRDIVAANSMQEKNMHNQYHWRILTQIHGISLSMQLFKRYVEENNITYDLVILARGDCKYYANFDTSKMHPSKIMFPTHSMHGDKLSILPLNCCPSPDLGKAFCDVLLAGSQSNMLVFATAYDNIIGYHKRDRICFNTETLLGNHCLRNGIDWTGDNIILHQLWRECKY